MSADITSVLGADLNFLNGIIADRGWEPVNAYLPSLCGTPLLRIAQDNRVRPNLSEVSGAEAIRHW